MPKTRYWKSLEYVNGKIVSDYDKSEWTVGEWRTVPAPERECMGLNCCENIVDTMEYVNIEILAEVEIGGISIVGEDKITSEKMRIIRAWKWEKTDSVAMAIYSAELCIDNFEKEYPNHKRPRKAIEAAKAWLNDPCDKTQSAARSAAESAAVSAARSAAVSAESAESAAESAASAASAARSAARSAAVSAESAESAAASAESAAESAARSAASAESAAVSAESAESAARSEVKTKIHNWIVNHTKELKEIK